MGLLNVFKKASDGLNKICIIISVVLLGGMVVVTSAQIICRVFFTALSWSEELARYLLIWSTFIGAGCVYKSKGHISIDIVQNLFKHNRKKVLKIIVQLLCIILFIIAIVYGFRYMILMGSQKSAALLIPMKYMYLAIPIGCSIMCIHAICLLLEEIFEKEVDK